MLPTIQVHNSFTGQKEVLRPIKPGEISLYSCGITVYDFLHIGHARMLSVFDLVARYLRHRGYKVTYVRNITDIDDKIIKRAAERGEPIEALTARFIAAMDEDCAKLGLLKPDAEPRATEYIDNIIRMIEQLIEREYAYVGTNGDVMYAVAKFVGYGKLSGKKLADLRAGARVDVDEAKRDPLDFVLWKMAKPGEPSWQSPWGAGRPGWHIECSAMSTAILGPNFDIHGGGMDLKFPHHENEIAQTCGASDAKFANVWMHNGFVNVDDEKMSKSLGNFFTVREVLPKVRHPEVMRYFLLSSHYRGPINYSTEPLENADAGLNRIYTALRDLPAVGEAPANAAAPSGAPALTKSPWPSRAPAAAESPWPSRTAAPAESPWPGRTPARSATPAPSGEHTARFHAVMDDDLNTPEAIAVLQTLTREINTARDAGKMQVAASLGAELRALAGVLGLGTIDPEEWFKLPAPTVTGDASAGPALSNGDVQQLVDARAAARVARNWAESDRLRDELLAAGILVEDKPGGKATWRRK